MAPLILDGDLLLIEPGPQWNHKTVVAVYMGRQVACKQLYLYDQSAALVSANPNYAPIIITEEMVILGSSDKDRTEHGRWLAAVRGL